MTDDQHQLLKDLDAEDEKWSLREQMVTTLTVVITVLLAFLAFYNYTSGRDNVNRIRCEEGDMTLILERADGSIERVECPIIVPRTPRGVDSWLSINPRGDT